MYRGGRVRKREGSERGKAGNAECGTLSFGSWLITPAHTVHPILYSVCTPTREEAALICYIASDINTFPPFTIYTKEKMELQESQPKIKARVDDLFGDSDNEAPPIAASPRAESSKAGSGSPRPAHGSENEYVEEPAPNDVNGSASPRGQEDEGDLDDLVCLFSSL